MTISLPKALFEIDSKDADSEDEASESEVVSEAEGEWRDWVKLDTAADAEEIAAAARNDAGLHLTSYGGLVFQYGKRIGRIFRENGGVAVTCYRHKPSCGQWVTLDENFTQDGIMAWLRCSSSFGNAAARLETLQIGRAFVEPCPQPEHAQPAEVVPLLPPAHREARRRAGARNVNKVDFGIWSVSVVRVDGVESSWGANCGKHRNCWESSTSRCKRSMVFGASSRPEEEARRRMKKWLLAGHAIDTTEPDGKEQHFNIDPHGWSIDEIEPEDELDAMADVIRAGGR